MYLKSARLSAVLVTSIALSGCLGAAAFGVASTATGLATSAAGTILNLVGDAVMMPINYLMSDDEHGSEFFSEDSVGVAASPRVNVSRGEKLVGRRHVGQPYTIAGKTFYPKTEPNYDRYGVASWYGSAFDGRLTANGEVFDRFAITAAHPTLPIPAYARVTNNDNQRSIMVRINDRGPFHGNRLIDLSERAATLLGYRGTGTANVRVQFVEDAPLKANDGWLENTLTENGRPLDADYVSNLYNQQSNRESADLGNSLR